MSRGKDARVRASKHLSYVLRHAPESIGLVLDERGWVAVDRLLAALAEAGKPLGRDELTQIVAESDKQRFAFDERAERIRARQGHSVDVDLGYAERVPPELLYHGTATRFLAAIRAQGLQKGERHHVHLSADAQTAHTVGQRHGKPVVLEVEALRLHASGAAFYLSDNGVWLVDSVAPGFLRFPAEDHA